MASNAGGRSVLVRDVVVMLGVLWEILLVLWDVRLSALGHELLGMLWKVLLCIVADCGFIDIKGLHRLRGGLCRENM